MFFFVSESIRTLSFLLYNYFFLVLSLSPTVSSYIYAVFLFEGASLSVRRF